MTPLALLEIDKNYSGDANRASSLKPESLESSNSKHWQMNSGSSASFIMRKKRQLDEQVASSLDLKSTLLNQQQVVGRPTSTTGLTDSQGYEDHGVSQFDNH